MLMELEAAIVSRLLATGSPVAPLIGGRIGPAGVNAMGRPNVVYQRITGDRVYGNQGPTGLARVRLQVSVYADDYGVARQIATAVRQRLDGFRGVIGAVSGAGGLTVQSVMLDDERDAPQPPSTGQTRGTPGVVQTYVIAFDE